MSTVRSFQETHFWIEIRTHLPVLSEKLKPIGSVIKSRSQICLPRRKSRRSRLRSIRIHYQILEEDKASVDAAGLVVLVQWIA